jgi:hypothetical protein
LTFLAVFLLDFLTFLTDFLAFLTDFLAFLADFLTFLDDFLAFFTDFLTFLADLRKANTFFTESLQSLSVWSHTFSPFKIRPSAPVVTIRLIFSMSSFVYPASKNKSYKLVWVFGPLPGTAGKIYRFQSVIDTAI